MSSQKMIFGLYVIFFSMLSLIGCSVTTEPEETNSLPNNTSVTFTSVQKEVFDKSCALAGCHSGVDAAAGMNLSAGSAYANLINIVSVRNAIFVRVQPGNSANSFIIKMLRNTGENTRIMPPSGTLNESSIQLVENWINNGAKND